MIVVYDTSLGVLNIYEIALYPEAYLDNNKPYKMAHIMDMWYFS